MCVCVGGGGGGGEVCIMTLIFGLLASCVLLSNREGACTCRPGVPFHHTIVYGFRAGGGTSSKVEQNLE